VPKAVVNERLCGLAVMEGVVERLDLASSQVVLNKGAAGPHGVTV